MANVIVLPVILNKVSSEEYALWNIFIAVQSFVFMFDMGFAKIVARYSTYAYCGAKSIPTKGLPKEPEKDVINYNLLCQILEVSKKIYFKIAIIAFTLLLGFSVYIYRLAIAMPDTFRIMLAWAIFSIGIIISIYFTYYTSFLKGVGKIKEMRVIAIQNDVYLCILKLFLVFCGMGLLGIAISNAFSVTFKRFRILRQVRKVLPVSNVGPMHEGEKEELQRGFESNAKQLGAIVIAQYVLSYGTTLLCSFFLPLDVIAEYGLTLQLIGIISSLISIPLKTFQPLLNKYRILQEKEKLKNIYSTITTLTIITYWCGVFVILVIFPFFLNTINSNILLLPPKTCILIALYQFMLSIHQKATDFIGLGNEQPYTRSFIIAAILSFLIGLFVLGSCRMGIESYIISNILLQLYNTWKWPRIARNIVGVTKIEMAKRGISQIYYELRRLVRA